MFRTNSWQKQSSSALCMNVCGYVRTHRQSLPSCARALASAESTTSSECMVTKFLTKKPPQSLMKFGQGYSKDLAGFTEDSSEQATLSASQSGTGYRRAMDVARPAHLGALIASKPWILDMLQGEGTAELLPEQPSLARLDTSIESAATFPRQPGCTCQEQPKQQTTHGSKQYRDTTAPPSRTHLCHTSNRVALHPNTTTTLNPHLLHLRKSRLSASQLQAQRSVLPDGNRGDASNTLCNPKVHGSR